MTKDKKIQYCKKNLKYISWLLTFWFIISFGCGILLVNFLNTITIGGFKLGFWFAQQGAIFGFVIIILYFFNESSGQII